MTEEKEGISKVKLALGAMSLFLFLVGVKRSFRREDGTEIHGDGDASRVGERAATPEEPLQKLRNAS